MGLIIFVLIVELASPFLSIWSLNLLFNLTIPVTFWTWLAAAWLSAVVYGSTRSSA